ncbi:MAG TPA: hypothetical protein VK395_00515 [Gemmataceae bacterium]|nr:hypothetical protein [Gemmataceae bacterium]
MNAAAIICEAQRQGVELIATAEGRVRWRCRAPLPDALRQQIQGQRAEILAILRANRPELHDESFKKPQEQTSAAQSLADLSTNREAELQELVKWFLESHIDLPVQPFDLYAWQKIVDPPKWYAALLQDINCGPCGARARMGTMASDLHRLRELFAVGEGLDHQSSGS